MTKSEIINKISILSRQLFSTAEGEVLLYGSQARGDEGEYSDWDLLVITDSDIHSPEEKRFDQFAFPFSRLGWDLGIEIIPLLYTTQEWKSQKDTYFYHRVMNESVKL